MPPIEINNLSVLGAEVANEIGAAAGTDTRDKLITVLQVSDEQLCLCRGIVASGLDAIKDGSIYKKTTYQEVATIDALISSGLDIVPDGAIYKKTTYQEVATIDALISSGLDTVSDGAIYKKTTHEEAEYVDRVMTLSGLDNISDSGMFRKTRAYQGDLINDETYCLLASNYSYERKSRDEYGVFRAVWWYDMWGVLRRTSWLAGTAPTYNQRIVQDFDVDGQTIMRTLTYNLTYNSYGELVSEVLI